MIVKAEKVGKMCADELVISAENSAIRNFTIRGIRKKIADGARRGRLRMDIVSYLNAIIRSILTIPTYETHRIPR
jgi:hypothetical protein